MRDDQADAERLDRARTAIAAAGASSLPKRPWIAGGQPHADLDLVRFAAWRAGESPEPGEVPGVIAAGLTLLGSARDELDQVEAGLLFAARDEGMTWSAIAQALGLGSAQAAQQRSERIVSRGQQS